MKPYQVEQYKGFNIIRCQHGSYAVVLAERTRFADTLAEIRQDIEAFIDCRLPEPKRGGF